MTSPGVRGRLPATRRLATTLPVLVLVVALAGCVSSDESQRQAEVPDDGLQATGILDGSRIAISRGGPEVVDGDCDANDGIDRDLCLRVRTIDGVSLNLVIENPDALVAGERLEVRPDPCTQCDDVRDHAVVRIRTDGGTRQAEGGHLTPSLVGARVAAEFDLRLPNGDRLTGSFSVRTRSSAATGAGG